MDFSASTVVQIYACTGKSGPGFAVWAIAEDDRPPASMVDAMLAGMQAAGLSVSDVAAARARADQALAPGAPARNFVYELRFCASVEEAIEVVRASLQALAPA